MDIFTTQLARVVSTPIKPTSLKVKALLKEAGSGKLKEDLDHLENHDYYFDEDSSATEQDKQNNSEQEKHQASSALTPDKVISTTKSHTENADEKLKKSECAIKHLDLYV